MGKGVASMATGLKSPSNYAPIRAPAPSQRNLRAWVSFVLAPTCAGPRHGGSWLRRPVVSTRWCALNVATINSPSTPKMPKTTAPGLADNGDALSLSWPSQEI